MSDRESKLTQSKRSNVLGSKRSRTNDDDPNHSTSTESSSELAQTPEAQTAGTKRRATAREMSLIKSLTETRAELEKLQESSFIICRANLTTALVKKLSVEIDKRSTPERTSQGDNDTGHNGTKWARLAEIITEADIKKANPLGISKIAKAVKKVLRNYSEVSLKP